jgi:hypothetical protein
MTTPPNDPTDPKAETTEAPVRKRPMIRVHGGDLAKAANRKPAWLRNAERAAAEAKAEATAEVTADEKKAAG